MRFVILGAACLLLIHAVRAQEAERPGLVHGNWLLRPSVNVLGAYDNRAETDGLRVEGGFYGEAGAALSMSNRGGKYAVSADAAYAYRYLFGRNDLSSDRYTVAVAAGSEREALSWSIRPSVRKSLSYDSASSIARYQGASLILRDEVSHTYALRGTVQYAGRVSDKTDLTPSYGYRFSYRDPEETETTQTQDHRFGLRAGYRYSERTTMMLDTSFSYQLGDDENGSVSRVMAGALYDVSELTALEALVGVAASDYQSSGTDQALIGSVRGTWRVNDKVSSYLYGANDYSPGYNGGAARLAYRLGYGGTWKMRERTDSELQLLHSYDKSLGEGSAVYSDEVLTFATARVGHRLGNNLAVDVLFRYVFDDLEDDKKVLSVRFSKKY